MSPNSLRHVLTDLQIADGAAAIISSAAGRAALESALRRPDAAGALLPHVARTARALQSWQLEALVRAGLCAAP